MASSKRENEAESALLRRLEALERTVFGHTEQANWEVHDLATKVDGIAKNLKRADGGGNRDLHDVAEQASSLGLLSAVTSAVPPLVEDTALKESIVLAARNEIEDTAKLLSQVKALEEHVNPPYLKDITQLSVRLTRLEGTYVGQAADAAWITDRAENARLHYSKAVSLISEKFVHWDDQVAASEKQHSAQRSGEASAIR